MNRGNVSVVKQGPAARGTLLVSGALQATLAAAAIATSTTHDVASILFMVLGGVGLAYIALAVAGRLPDGWQSKANSDGSRGRTTRDYLDSRLD